MELRTGTRNMTSRFKAQVFQIKKGGSHDFLLQKVSASTALRSHSISFSTSTYSFKLETGYNFCNEVKKGVSAIWLVCTGITLAFVGLPAPT